MPVSSKIDKEHRLVICEIFGHVVDEDGPALQRAIREDPDFDPGFSQLLDMTGVTKVDANAETVRRLAQTSVFSPNARRAFVANSDVIFGFARMFEMLRESAGGTALRVFRSRDDAMRWLLKDDKDAE
jgi:hypothetical protein